MKLGVCYVTLTLLKLAGGASKLGGTGEMNLGQANEKASSNAWISLSKKEFWTLLVRVTEDREQIGYRKQVLTYPRCSLCSLSLHFSRS